MLLHDVVLKDRRQKLPDAFGINDNDVATKRAKMIKGPPAALITGPGIIPSTPE
jgi:hypothetical protein